MVDGKDIEFWSVVELERVEGATADQASPCNVSLLPVSATGV
ncbi:TRAF3-interacting protein 1-like [Iris pallida]|uniref:TRAF3-interacting protein 1-like n=1 Tax=Iris pallida TaxID=29817 RepID=A0AAX6FHY2_IRIPA|nr:TRAF3-interacting protein 1-like [Iris pallida]KAJ6815581.1 TRAF3-interacting protein 1-like [Iris pallida]